MHGILQVCATVRRRVCLPVRPGCVGQTLSNAHAVAVMCGGGGAATRHTVSMATATATAVEGLPNLPSLKSPLLKQCLSVIEKSKTSHMEKKEKRP